MTLSFGFYLGIGTLLLLLIAGAVFFPSPATLVDQHADPAPASDLSATVVTSPGSNLYHGGAGCSHAHPNSKQIATSDAVRQGLIPCPYCIGNSSARLLSSASSGRADP